MITHTTIQALDALPAQRSLQLRNNAAQGRSQVIWKSETPQMQAHPSLSIGDIVFIRDDDGKKHIHGVIAGLDEYGFRVAPAHFHPRNEVASDRITFGDRGDVFLAWSTVGPVHVTTLDLPKNDANAIVSDEAIELYSRYVTYEGWPCKWP